MDAELKKKEKNVNDTDSGYDVDNDFPSQDRYQNICAAYADEKNADGETTKTSKKMKK